MNQLQFIGFAGTGGANSQINDIVNSYVVGLSLLSCLITCLAIWIVLFVIRRFTPKRPRFDWRFFVGSIVIGLVIFPGSVYLREYIDDANWSRIQDRCAQEVGYSSPIDNNNFSIATADSQYAYNRCINGLAD